MCASKSTFYDGTKLLSLMDINGNRPEIYMCTTNRSGGKTTYFNRLLTNSWIKKKEKFCLIYRYNYELDDVANKFFKDINTLFFKDYTMDSIRKANGIYHELVLINNRNNEAENCGYAISLNSADQIKRLSHFFSDTQRMLFDEFQSETNHYCNDEVTKFISVHQSIARGQGKQSRYVPVYMIANPVTILNPYYVEMDIATRLNGDTNFLRGDGFVLEQGYVESAADAQTTSAFNRAFSRNKYTAYASQGVYLNDNLTFIEKPKGISRYICTLRYNGTDFAIREFAEQGVIYCDDKADKNNPNRISVTTQDHNVNFVMLKRNDLFVSNMRYYFDHGCFRFKDLRCKDAVLKMLSY